MLWSVLFSFPITSGCRQIPLIGITSGILLFHSVEMNEVDMMMINDDINMPLVWHHVKFGI